MTHASSCSIVSRVTNGHRGWPFDQPGRASEYARAAAPLRGLRHIGVRAPEGRRTHKRRAASRASLLQSIGRSPAWRCHEPDTRRAGAEVSFKNHSVAEREKLDRVGGRTPAGAGRWASPTLTHSLS